MTNIKKENRKIAAEKRRKEILKEGQKVFDTDAFNKGFTQVHHKSTTVSNHTLEVADTALMISEFLIEKGIYVNRDEVIISALCHDLGIIDRDKKWNNSFSCWIRHPKDSVKIAEELYPLMSDHMKRVISRHMWPATPLFPTSREGWILDLADTICSMNDFFHPNHRHFLGDMPIESIFVSEDMTKRHDSLDSHFASQVTY